MRGSPPSIAAVVIAADDYESLVVTVELLSNPDYHRKMEELNQTADEYLSQAEAEVESRWTRPESRPRERRRLAP